jgi:peptidoglycan hydrolase-like protein with peptidoglycan-binding domain
MEAVRGLAKAKQIETGGEVNAEVAERLGPAADEGLPPNWYTRDLELYDEGEDVRGLNKALGFKDNDNRFWPDTESAVRRLQADKGLPIDGKVNLNLARIIGSF